MQNDVGNCVIFVPNKLSRQGRQFYQRSLFSVILIDLCNAIEKTLDKISFHKHLKRNRVKRATSISRTYKRPRIRPCRLKALR